MTNTQTKSNFKDEHDNVLVQNNDNPNRKPDDDSNDADQPVEPDKGDEIPQTENDDVLNESIVAT